jgi:hypothetical protein
MAHIQTKNIQLAEYDIVGMFAENLVEVGCLVVDSGKKKIEFTKKLLNLKVAHCLY